MPAATPKILLADDQSDMRSMIRLWLNRGLGFTEVSSGEEALAVSEAEPFDMLLLDYMMPPGITGLEVARRLRARGDSRPIVLFSAYLSAEVAGDAVDLGVKPVDKSDLDELCDTVLSVVGRGSP